MQRQESSSTISMLIAVPWPLGMIGLATSEIGDGCDIKTSIFLMIKLRRNEIGIMKQLAHPNVVKQIDYGISFYKKGGVEKPFKFIALELCKGGELFDFIAHGGPFSERACRYYFK